MRTTLNLDDDLYKAVKIAAAERGVSVTSVVESALRTALNAQATVQRPEFPVSPRSGGVRRGVDLSNADQIYELLYGGGDAGRADTAIS